MLADFPMFPVGDRIRQIRLKNDLTVKELALLIGVSGAYVTQIEHGQRRISIDMLATVLRILKVPFSVFFSEDFDIENIYTIKDVEILEAMKGFSEIEAREVRTFVDFLAEKRKKNEKSAKTGSGRTNKTKSKGTKKKVAKQKTRKSPARSRRIASKSATVVQKKP